MTDGQTPSAQRAKYVPDRDGPFPPWQDRLDDFENAIVMLEDGIRAEMSAHHGLSKAEMDREIAAQLLYILGKRWTLSRVTYETVWLEIYKEI